MRFDRTVQVKRVDDVFYIDGFSVEATRRASDGYGVLIILEGPTQLDRDFKPFLGSNRYGWFITAKQHDIIARALDLSDAMTRDWLRNGKGWRCGPRPVKELKDYV